MLGSFQTAPLLRHYDPSLATRLETDASDVALGGVLSQLQEDTKQWHPIAFFSKQFKGAELNYSTPDKELMVIVECFKHWRHYLEGSSHTIEVWSDHMNLQGFMKQPRINGRQARWLVYLTPYDFLIYHRPGLLNPADGPSRRPDYMASAQKEPGLLQKDLLAERLAGSDFPSRAGEIPGLAQGDLKAGCLAGSASYLPEAEEPCDLASTQLYEAVGSDESQADSGLPEIGLYRDTCIGQPKQELSRLVAQEAEARLPRAARAHECKTAVFDQSRLWLRKIAEQQPEDSEAGHLLELVRIQAVTRKGARKAT